MQQTVILIICSGNTCRSAMAEGIARDILSKHKSAKPSDSATRFKVISAGTFASDGMPPAKQAIAVMRQEGINIAGHLSQPVTQQLIDSADVIYTMTDNHRQHLLETIPKATEKTFNLNPRKDIEDPVGLDRATYKKVADEIRLLLEKRLGELIEG